MSSMLERLRDSIYRAADGELYEEEAEVCAQAALETLRYPTQEILDAGPGEPYMDAYVWGKMIERAMRK